MSAITTDLWPIFENAQSTRSIGYIVSTDDISGLAYPRIGEVYRTPRGWAAWPMGAVFGDDHGPRSDLGFKSRSAAIEYLIDAATDRSER